MRACFVLWTAFAAALAVSSVASLPADRAASTTMMTKSSSLPSAQRSSSSRSSSTSWKGSTEVASKAGSTGVASKTSSSASPPISNSSAPTTSSTTSNATVAVKDTPAQASACTAFAAYLPTLLSSGKATPDGIKLTVKTSLAAYYQGVNPSTKELIDLIPDDAFGPQDSKKGAISGAGEWNTTSVMMDEGYGQADVDEQQALGLLPPFCRIGASIETSESSQTWFEVWLPLPRDDAHNGASGQTQSPAANPNSSSSIAKPLVVAKTWSRKEQPSSSSSSSSSASSSSNQSTGAVGGESTAFQHVLARSDLASRTTSITSKTTRSTSSKSASASTSASTGASTGASTSASTGASTSAITNASTSSKTDSASSSTPSRTDLTASPSTSAPTTQPSVTKVSSTTTKKPAGLPASGDNWNGRLLVIGTGGQKGTVIYPELKQVLTRYREAAAGTNAGHWGSGSDTTWTIGAPEAQIDFGHRGVHVSTLASKAVVSQFYGARSFGTDRTNEKDATGLTFRSYFKGCSTGGRQAMVSAQRYPADFDGIMAGSPAIDYNYLNAYQIHVNSFQNDTSSPRYIPEELYATIHEAALNQCDASDGQKDGIIGNVFDCDPRDYVPSIACQDQQGVPANSTTNTTTTSLASAAAPAAKIAARSSLANVVTSGTSGDPATFDNVTTSSTPSCLTQPQIDNLYDIYDTFKIGDTLIHEPVLPGSETGWTVLDGVGGTPFPAAPGWFKYQVLNMTDKRAPFDPYTQVTPEVIFQGQQADAGGTIGFDANLRPFFRNGGKLVHYHGLADQLIPSGSSFRYHKLVTNNYSRFGSSYAFFPVPGMNHCRSGDGAFNFGGAGQTDQAGWRPLSYDAEHDLTLALFQWVEQGAAPTHIIGAAYKNSTFETIGSYSADVLAPRPFQNGVKLTRRFCPWPKTAQLIDDENRGAASGYKCT